MRAGRCKYTTPILIRTERGLRDAAAEAARERGLSLSELVRQHLRSVAGTRMTEARP